MHNKGPRCRAIQQAKQTDAEQLLIDQQSVWVQLRVACTLNSCASADAGWTAMYEV